MRASQAAWPFRTIVNTFGTKNGDDPGCSVIVVFGGAVILDVDSPATPHYTHAYTPAAG
jgi:hypothetical protein